MKGVKLGILIWTLALLTTNCAQLQNYKSKSDAQDGQISEGTAIDLMRRSFFVGCMNGLHMKGLKGVAAECKTLALQHQKEIEEILKLIPEEKTNGAEN